MKSVCVNLVSLFELEKSYESALDCVLNSLNLFNFGRVSAKKLTEDDILEYLSTNKQTAMMLDGL